MKIGQNREFAARGESWIQPRLNHVLLFVCLYLKKSLDNVNDHKTTLQTWMDLDLLQPLIVRCVYPVALCAAVGLQSPPEALE